MVHGKNRIPYRIDRRLTGLAGPEYDATISVGLPFEPEDSNMGNPGFLSFLLACRKIARAKSSAELGLGVLSGILTARCFVRACLVLRRGMASS